jgi:hypothetical protein
MSDTTVRPVSQAASAPLSVAAPVAVSTSDGLLRSEFDRRLADVRKEAHERGLREGCGGVGGGWGN